MTEAPDRLRVQTALARRIINFKSTALKTPTDKRSVGWFKTQVELLDSQWKDFFQEDLQLMAEKKDHAEQPYFKEDLCQNAFTQYTSTKSLFLNAISPGRNQSSMLADQTQGELQMEPPPYKNSLPPITLPKFSGKKDEWEAYKGMFIALVHDVPSIAPVLKLNYLDGSLEGDARSYLLSPPFTGDKYDGAWKALLDKYDSQKYLLSSHLTSLITCPRIKKRSLPEFNRVIDTMRVSKQSIDTLNIPAEKLGELCLIHHIFHKLDFRTLIEWETEADNSEDYPTYPQYLKFLEKQARILDAAHNTFEDQESSPKSKSPQTKPKAVSSHQAQTSSKCVLCQGEHFLYACSKFKEMPVSQRLQFCKGQNLCLNCLRSGHFLQSCQSQRRCYTCKGKHHAQLHKETVNESTSSTKNEISASPSETQETVSTHSAHLSQVGTGPTAKSALLGTAIVILADSHGYQQRVRALIDPGSEKTFISERVLLSLSPRINKVKVSVMGVGNSVTSVAHKEATLFVRSDNMEKFSINISAYILTKLTTILLRDKVDCSQWSYIQGLTLADPAFFKPDKIDCLLGADVYDSIMLPGLFKGQPETPMAQQTVFGWILTGAFHSTCSSAHATVQVFHSYLEPQLDSLLTRFWEVQEIPQQKHLTQEERDCETYFAKTITRNEEGRYVVRLSFKRNYAFTGSKDVAIS